MPGAFMMPNNLVRGGMGGVGGDPNAPLPILPPLPQLPPDVAASKPTPVSVSLKAAPDPTITWATGEMKKLYGGDMGAGRAIDIAGGKIREAGVGANAALSENLARRGVSGTGVEGLQRGRLANTELADIGSAAAGISSDAERRREGLLTGAVGAGSAQAAVQQGETGTQLQAAEIDAANQRAAEAAAQARQQAMLQMLIGLA